NKLNTQPPVRTTTEPRVHDRTAPVEQTAQVAGKDEVTQTPNPRAMFNMNKGGADEPDNVGNPRAPEGDDKASGTGPGLNPDGLDQLDQGLKGRGLAGALPKPSYPGSKSGKIVVRVTVDASGKVTGAAYEPKGSTESDAELVAAAIEAARKARFTESRATVQGGTITYIFRME
uniref:TonB family protein n=1 Tax=uncultured Alistipes sp. TaxID=538949 RepID=UPI0027D96D42